MATVTRCCIAGGGPAGMVLGNLLARAGVSVTVLAARGRYARCKSGDSCQAG